jgi:hypothetical protein
VNTNATIIDSLRQLRDNAKVVVVSPAFKEWERQITGQIEGRKNELLKPVETHDGLVAQEYMKGEAVGMLQAQRQWSLMLELVEQEIEELLKEEGDEAEVEPQRDGP